MTKEYYVNDAGAQVDTLARSVHLRYREALGEAIGDIPEGMYPGDYLKPVGERLAAEHGNKFATSPEAEWLAVFRGAAIEAMIALIRHDLGLLDIHHDKFASEAELQATRRTLLVLVGQATRAQRLFRISTGAEILWNLTTAPLVEHAVRRGEGVRGSAFERRARFGLRVLRGEGAPGRAGAGRRGVAGGPGVPGDGAARRRGAR